LLLRSLWPPPRRAEGGDPIAAIFHIFCRKELNPGASRSEQRQVLLGVCSVPNIYTAS
jgi:hypothetical protein